MINGGYGDKTMGAYMRKAILLLVVVAVSSIAY
jgi:hypothetical protein